jgi:thioredoxin reductase/ferredoxin
MNPIASFYHWLHGKWPAGKVERLPVVHEHGRTNVPGVYVVGDLSGIPLLKMSMQTGVEAIRDAAENTGKRQGDYDVVIIGGGVSGVAAAIEAAKQGLSYLLLESSQMFNTIANFPKKKPIFTYPTEMIPAGDLQVSAQVKEELLSELSEQVQAHNITATEGYATHVSSDSSQVTVHLKDESVLTCANAIIAIGRSGNYRRMNIPGEELDKVSNRLHDPAAFIGQRVMVVGGGDSAVEAAGAMAELNEAEEPLVTLVYRGAELSRPKPENVQKVHDLAAAGKIDLRLGTAPTSISDNEVSLKRKGGDGEESIPNQAVLSLIGREAPLDFFRRSGIPIHGEFRMGYKLFLAAILLFITGLYGMKTLKWFEGSSIWLGNLGTSLSGVFGDQSSFFGSMAIQAQDLGLWVTMLYSTAVVTFGIDRLRRRKTPYVKLQTITLMTIQCVPLFILPELILPWMDRNNWIPETIMQNLFTGYYYNSDGSLGSYDAYWHAYGFILAWPLLAWIVFSPVPLTWWLIISFVQTFVIIPLLIWRYGKGAYCGWICSCGALAETMGDRHREKMPHGPAWNKLNMVGQVILWFAIGLLVLHSIMWIVSPETGWQWVNTWAMKGIWKPVVDFALAGALGTGLYFALSGRVWCRFACPLAALMHIFARFSRFRIVVEQKKCISCNACTSVCHQGIDIMNFANKGKHMEDPECVRCSACVQTCPTGVLQFGRVDGEEKVVGVDSLVASPVHMREGK